MTIEEQKIAYQVKAIRANPMASNTKVISGACKLFQNKDRIN